MLSFDEIVEQMDENQTVLLGDAPDGEHLAAFPLETSTVNELLNDPKFVFVFSSTLRPGCSLFTRYLELKYFHPDSGKNDLMVTMFHKWQSILWVIVGVPKVWDEYGELINGEKFLQEAVEFAGLRIVEGNYVQMIMGGKGEPNSTFQGVPVHTPSFDMSNVRCLEGNGKNRSNEELYAMMEEVEKQYL